MDVSGDDDYHSAAECIQAGMYWFSQSDFAAAEAWWRRALELEPDNARAASCLRLLQKTSSTGYKQDSWARMPAASGPPHAPRLEDPFAAPKPEAQEGPTSAYELLRPESSFSLDLASVEEEADEEAADLEPATSPLDVREALAADVGVEERSEEPTFDLGEEEEETASSASTDTGGASIPTGALVFGASSSDEAMPGSEPLDGSSIPIPTAPSSATASTSDGTASDGVVSPWDVGPSRTSVITIDAGGGFDAVPDPTPLPAVDRDVFFNRGDPSSREEIVTFLRGTGDLPEPSDLDDAAYPILEEPVEAAEAGEVRLDALPDALSTEPSTSVREVSPEAALAVARGRYQLHDFQGVLDVLDEYPSEESHQTEVRNMLAESRANLLKMYEAKIGPLDQIPEVLVSSEEIIWLNLNHRAGFILSQVDGTVSYDDLISLSGMPRLDTVRILTELLDQRVIGVGSA